MIKKSKGSLMDFMTVSLTILAVVVVVVTYFNLSELMNTKLDISQITRRYILRMETKGYLDAVDREHMLKELGDLGVRDIDLSGSTLVPVAYGETIILSVRGTIRGAELNTGNGWLDGFVQREYNVAQKRMSTAKN